MTIGTDRATVIGARIAAGDDRTRYDDVSRALHWLTAVLVLGQFGLAQLWDFWPGPVRRFMVMLHMSLGVVLTVVLVARVAWRLMPGHQVAPATTGWVEVASKAAHYLLYVLLGAEAVLGFLWRWSGGEDMKFFGLLLPSPMPKLARATTHLFGDLHNWGAWTIIVVALGHTAAALYHHFVLHDDVLWRMLPGRDARREEIRAPSPEQAAQKG